MFDQDVGIDIEFILVGDSSGDDIFTTADIPSQLQNLTRLFWFPPQGRPAAARNFGVEQSRDATHLMFVDSDDRICALASAKPLKQWGGLKLMFIHLTIATFLPPGNLVLPMAEIFNSRGTTFGHLCGQNSDIGALCCSQILS